MLELPNKTPIIDTFWLEKLCYYDRRNPDFEIKEEFGYDKEEVEATGNFAKKDCVCDNCFYGRTKMAEKYIFELPNQEEDFTILDKVIEEESKIAYLQTGSLTSIEIVKRAASAGYKAAQKQYSEADIRNAFKAGRKKQSTNPSGEYEFDTVDSYLQSLQKKQFPIAVEFNPSEAFPKLKWYYE